MAARRTSAVSAALFRFDRPYRDRFGHVAGVDEVGRGPLAGPVVSAAVILSPDVRIPLLNDSKQLNAAQREQIYRLIQRSALAIGIGIIEHVEIDRINIYQAGLQAMRVALHHLVIRPTHVLVDGFRIPGIDHDQTGLIGGDGRSACIAAASIVAKVTRDAIMETMDRLYPHYGFKKHKGYGTPEHLHSLAQHGPCPIHRHSFAPVRKYARS